jgi:hypothetical protein
MDDTFPEPAESLVAADLCRGTLRLLAERGESGLAEVRLGNGRRADILALDGGGRITIVEIKSSVADFRADAKWLEYLDYCDRFYFAVAAGFPADILPVEHGLIIADRHGGAVLRETAALPAVPASRRRSLTLRFAVQAADRLRRREDPAI